MSEAAVQDYDIDALMRTIGERAKAASRTLALAPADRKAAALRAAAADIRAHMADILDANARDITAAEAKGLTRALIDRLALDEERVEGIAAGLEAIAELPDPIGTVLAEWDRPNGLKIERVRVPLGVIGIIYEARPNVTADAGGLSLKSGNAAILRGGSESFHSSSTLAECLRRGITSAGLPADAVQLIPTTDRDAVGRLLAMPEYVDVIVPRGGKSLIERVLAESRVPVFAHLEGLCHIYLDREADPDMAREVVMNAKMRRTSVCGAVETLLVDRAAAETLLPRIIADLSAAGCAIRGDETVQALDPRVLPATEEDWRTEYLDAIISIKVVDDVDAAIEHVNHYGSHHTDSIVTANGETAERFLNGVDSGIVMHNTSTQFADGGEFGMGAEIGISTGKMHARGPVGAEQLTSYKYRVRGAGQVRP